MACINRFLLVILDHQESLDAQSREPQQAGEEEMEPDQGEDMPPNDELPQFDTGIPELEDLDLDDGEECSDGVKIL